MLNISRLALFDGTFLSILREGMIDMAVEMDGVRLQIEDAQNDLARRLDQINKFVASSVDAIIFIMTGELGGAGHDGFEVVGRDGFGKQLVEGVQQLADQPGDMLCIAHPRMRRWCDVRSNCLENMNARSPHESRRMRC